MFEEMTGDGAMLVKGGVYRPCPLYRRANGDLFARYGAGYVRLYANGGTSMDALKIELLHTNEPLFVDRFGRLGLVQHEGFKPLNVDAARLLLAP